MSWWLFSSPFLSAIFGWLITSIAVKIYVRRIQLKFRLLQAGEAGKSESELVKSISVLISNHLITLSEIEQQVFTPANLQKIMPLAEEHIDVFLRQKLKVQLPVIGSLIGDRTIVQLKEVFMAELEELFPIVMKSYIAAIKTGVKFEEIIASKIQNVPLYELKSIIAPFLSVETKHIRFYGMILGFLIGVLQLIITLSLV